MVNYAAIFNTSLNDLFLLGLVLLVVVSLVVVIIEQVIKDKQEQLLDKSE